MERCEVLIVGGGPAGSTCAWKLRQAGIDVAVIDKATFPRDKVCAGWITPQVVEELDLDVADYEGSRTFQRITGFRVGLADSEALVDVAYERPVSFGIRRCEFDHYLLHRSGARLMLGAAVSAIRRDGGRWIVNDSVSAAVLVGAGGHFCPVGRLLNGAARRAPLVAAQEAEFELDADAIASSVEPEKPELYFDRDLAGYSWCFRKQRHVNVGLGRVDARGLPKAAAQLVAVLKARRKVPPTRSWQWHGHAYLLASSSPRHVVDDGVVLIGDSAGLAYAQSGEGIRPAVESGLLAASTIAACDGCYTRDRLKPYVECIQSRFGVGAVGDWMSALVPPGLAQAVAARLLDSQWFVRHLVLDRWFLHRRTGSLTTSSPT